LEKTKLKKRKIMLLHELKQKTKEIKPILEYLKMIIEEK
jgi:hypothetical protein